MRGGVQLWLLPPLLCVLVLTGAVAALRCQRTPDGRVGDRTPADGRFFVKISGNIDSYVANTVYTVTLQGTHTSQPPSKFTGFLLVAEPDSRDPVSDSFVSNQKQNDVGTFQTLGDSLTKYSEKCPNAVTHASSLPKSEISALWTAPPAGSGCVTIKATVVEHHDIWYMDEGPLSKTLCENVQESFDMQPAIVSKCCACDEAKYEVTFEGLWSRHTHPKDFPSNGWLTRFSDVIGASHASDYRFWDYGRHASEGLRQLAEHGATRVLESELKAEVGKREPESNHIRTIIKARGISYPNLTGKTFAVFRVDNRHHLMSLVSMIDPSPDWIVGVSGLELCLPNCTWIESKILNLYPWDAGTDSGPTYISPDQPTTPRDVIRRIRPNYPNDPRSPFYDPSGAEMKPMARLYLSRQRLYEKSCDNNGISGADDDLDADPCALTGWGEWSPCSVTCGKGRRRRQRWYRSQSRAEAAACSRSLSSREACWGARKDCRQGQRKKGRIDEESGDGDDSNCPTTPWSDWMPCSATCGDGVRMKTRKLMLNDRPQQDMPYSRVHSKRAHWNSEEPEKEEEDEEEAGEEEEGEKDATEEQNEPAGRCSHVKMVEIAKCRAEIPTCDITEDEAKRDDQLFPGLDTGNQMGPKLAGDVPRRQLTGDGSLSGNDGPTYPPNINYVDMSNENGRPRYGKERKYKNYDKENRHHDTRHRDRDNDHYSDSRRPEYESNEEDRENSHRFDRLRPGYPETGEVIEEAVGQIKKCEVTPWSEWSECNVTCGRGIQIKSRKIIQHPVNGGRSCPKKLLKRRRCKNPRPCREYKDNADEDQFDSTDPTWGPGNNIYNARQDCVLSEWSRWSPCSETCGESAIKQRTRTILQHPSNGGAPCGPRLDKRSCELWPCPM